MPDDHLDPGSERLWTPSSTIGGHWQPYAGAYRRGTAEARATLGSVRLSPYIEVYRPPDVTGPIPALVFVHGGYWQEQGLDDAGFAALDLAARGAALVAVSYPLAPAVTVAEIARSVLQSLLLTAGRAPGLGIDRSRTVVSGHSAGAHLVARAAASLGPGWPFGPLTLISGVFDPVPLVTTSVNVALGLTRTSAQMISALPISRAAVLPAAVVCWAELDTVPFHQQALQIAEAWEASGAAVRRVGPVPDRNHFDIVLDVGDPSTALGDAVDTQLSASTRRA